MKTSAMTGCLLALMCLIPVDLARADTPAACSATVPATPEQAADDARMLARFGEAIALSHDTRSLDFLVPMARLIADYVPARQAPAEQRPAHGPVSKWFAMARVKAWIAAPIPLRDVRELVLNLNGFYRVDLRNPFVEPAVRELDTLLVCQAERFAERVLDTRSPHKMGLATSLIGKAVTAPAPLQLRARAIMFDALKASVASDTYVLHGPFEAVDQAMNLANWTSHPELKASRMTMIDWATDYARNASSEPHWSGMTPREQALMNLLSSLMAPYEVRAPVDEAWIEATERALGLWRDAADLSDPKITLVLKHYEARIAEARTRLVD